VKVVEKTEQVYVPPDPVLWENPAVPRVGQFRTAKVRTINYFSMIFSMIFSMVFRLIFSILY
jgi:hypothetical protein